VAAVDINRLLCHLEVLVIHQVLRQVKEIMEVLAIQTHQIIMPVVAVVPVKQETPMVKGLVEMDLHQALAVHP